MKANTPPRDVEIDLLKLIGLSLIILAHVSPPYFIFQLRNFDVPLMVAASGMAYSFTREEQNQPKLYGYIFLRFSRLVLPVWVFLTFYFVVKTLFFDTRFSLNTIALSYSLISGIGYVWIIRIFLIIALISPALHAASKSLSTPAFFLCSLFVATAIEAWSFFFAAHHEPLIKIIEATIVYSAGYATCFALGLRFKQLATKELVFWGTCSFFLFIATLIHQGIDSGLWFDLQSQKYPPRTMYLSYAFFASTGLVLIFRTVKFSIYSHPSRNVFAFACRNTIWIYLWHIAFLDIVRADNFFVRYILVYASATLTTAFQVYLLERLLQFSCITNSTKAFFRRVLSG